MHLELPQSIAKDSYGMLWIASASREIGNRSVDIGHWLKTGHDFHCFHWFSIVIIVLLFLLLLQLQLPPLLLRLLLSRSGAGSSCTVFSAIGVQLGEFHQCHWHQCTSGAGSSCLFALMLWCSFPVVVCNAPCPNRHLPKYQRKQKQENQDFLAIIKSKQRQQKVRTQLWTFVHTLLDVSHCWGTRLCVCMHDFDRLFAFSRILTVCLVSMGPRRVAFVVLSTLDTRYAAGVFIVWNKFIDLQRSCSLRPFKKFMKDCSIHDSWRYTNTSSFSNRSTAAKAVKEKSCDLKSSVSIHASKDLRLYCIKASCEPQIWSNTGRIGSECVQTSNAFKCCS